MYPRTIHTSTGVFSVRMMVKMSARISATIMDATVSVRLVCSPFINSGKYSSISLVSVQSASLAGQYA